jgi:hypothetical protein
MTDGYEPVQGRTDLFVRYTMFPTNFDKVESLLTTLVLGQHPVKKRRISYLHEFKDWRYDES